MHFCMSCSSISVRDCQHGGACIHFTVMDHDLLLTDDFAGEAFLSFNTIPGISREEISGFSALTPLNLSLTHPKRNTCMYKSVVVSVRTFSVMYYHTLFYACMQFTRSDIRPHVKLAVSLVIVGGHLIFLRGFVVM